MIAPVPQSGADERQPLLSNSSDRDGQTKQGSLWYRARRSPVAVTCVVAMALFTDMVVYGVVVPILPIIVKERLGGSSSDVGLLFACYAIGLLASTPVFAILSDKYQNRRIPMMVGMLGLAVATIGFSLASNYWVLIMARIGQGSAGGASWTIGLGMLADVYPPDNLGVVMGVVMMANAIGFIMGPMVGAYFYEYHGYAAPFAFCAALAVLDFLCILFIAEPEKKKIVPAGSTDEAEQDVGNLIIAEDPTKEGSRQPIKSDHSHNYGSTSSNSYASSVSSSASSSRSSTSPSSCSSVSEEEDKASAGEDVSMFTIASDWTITCCLLATFVAASVFSGLEPILPLYLDELLHAQPTQTGLILIAAIFPTLLSSLIGYYADRVGHFNVSFVGMFIFATATFLLSLPKSFLAFIVPLALFGFGSSMILTPLLPAMADVVTKKGWNGYAKTYALYNMVYSLSMAAGPILAGYIYKDFGFSWTMVMFGSMIIVAIPIIFSSQIAVVLAKWRGVRPLSNNAHSV
ncbi:MAG: major facilitator superfamily domain-containing protein [Benniella sp.]|nr:MAG: major facilitator superfamily domain-containing protein [Benniella sp.]